MRHYLETLYELPQREIQLRFKAILLEICWLYKYIIIGILNNFLNQKSRLDIDIFKKSSFTSYCSVEFHSISSTSIISRRTVK